VHQPPAEGREHRSRDDRGASGHFGEAQLMIGRVSAHVGIVGGGVLGMFLALKLRQSGARVTLLESAPRTGGLACADDVGGYTWDRFYHVILLSDAYTRGLLEELGIADKLRFGLTRTGFYTDGKLYSLSNN
jgi:protoporphyrinogen oxidase